LPTWIAHGWATDVSLARLARGTRHGDGPRHLPARASGPETNLPARCTTPPTAIHSFVEEVLKGLVLSGDLSRAADGRMACRDRSSACRVPRTASEAVRRRLSGLSVPARELASVARRIGRRFDFRLLQEVVGTDERKPARAR